MNVCAARRGSISFGSAWPGAAGRRGTRVLVVTPDGDFRAAARRVLEEAGYDVADAAHSGHALLACMMAGQVDVAIVEAALEDMRGTALVERLRRRQPRLRAVYIGPAGAAPRADLLARPVRREVLLDRLEALTSAPAY